MSYKATTTIQFQYNTDYGITYPFLYPALIACLRLIVDLGIYSGVFVNLILFAGTFALLIRICRQLDLPNSGALLLAASLLYDGAYRHELFIGKSNAVQVFLLAAILTTLLDLSNDYLKNSFKAGLLTGALMLARFDTASFSVLLPFCLLVISPKHIRLHAVAIYAIGLGFMMSPWIAYSTVHFGKLWISDKSLSPLTIQIYYGFSYFEDITVIPTIFDAPYDWLDQRGQWFARLVRTFWNGMRSTLVLPTAIIAALQCVRFDLHKLATFWEDNRFRTLLVVSIAGLGYLVGPGLTGMIAIRYYIPSYFFIIILLVFLLAFLASGGSSGHQLRYDGYCGSILGGLGLLALALAVFDIYRPNMARMITISLIIASAFLWMRLKWRPGFDATVYRLNRDLAVAVTTIMLVIISRHASGKRNVLDQSLFYTRGMRHVLALTEPNELILAPNGWFYFGALTDRPTIYTPDNATSGNAVPFLLEYGVRYVVTNPFWSEVLMACFVTKGEASSGVVKVVGLKDDVLLARTETVNRPGWERGVGLAGASVLLRPDAVPMLAVGNRLRFAAGGSRTVESIERMHDIMKVGVSGPGLSPKLDGSPNRVAWCGGR